MAGHSRSEARGEAGAHDPSELASLALPAALLRSAADLEDSTDKHPVTPGPVLPAREQLGDLLLELSRSQEALAAYEVSNRTAPNRRNGVAGAGRARGALEGR